MCLGNSRERQSERRQLPFFACTLNHGYLLSSPASFCPSVPHLPLKMLPPPPPGLRESLKTRYFIIHGASHPNGSGLERFWIPRRHSPEVLTSCIDEPVEVWTTLLVYMPCADMPCDQRQHALTVCGYALEAQRLMRPHLARHSIPASEPDNAAEKEIHQRTLRLALADRQHILRDTPASKRNVRHARLALGRAWAATAATSTVFANVFEAPRS
ncbi:hypothetical protein B0H13DRAFT_2338501 [Mycena leptocephala]|nr:hypothetical protein B0H13DRAFT_2338501 [Mycena leptocephala]